MAELTQLATADDYSALFGEPPASLAGTLGARLTAASGYLLSYLTGYERGGDPVLDQNLRTVACSMVHRALSVPEGMEGVSSWSQTAGPYSVSNSFTEQYMRPLPSELEMLGISGGTVLGVRMGPGGSQ